MWLNKCLSSLHLSAELTQWTTILYFHLYWYIDMQMGHSFLRPHKVKIQQVHYKFMR